MLQNKKGAALLQVLLVTAVLGGMVAMLLRVNLSRVTSGRQTRKAVSQELLIEACQAQINLMWSNKTPWAFERDLSGCWMNCLYKENPTDPNEQDTWKPGDDYTQSKCNDDTEEEYQVRYYECKLPTTGSTVTVRARFLTNNDGSPKKDDGHCHLQYRIVETAIEQL